MVSPQNGQISRRVTRAPQCRDRVFLRLVERVVLQIGLDQFAARVVRVSDTNTLTSPTSEPSRRKGEPISLDRAEKMPRCKAAP